MKEALLYRNLEKIKLHCRLCAHNCKIGEGKFGFCKVRQNIAGVLYTHNYGKLVAANVDPIEKKPLYHFLPGTLAFSIAGAGCNFRCSFCQNWEISQLGFVDQQPANEEYSADKVVKLALANNCKSIAYTYTEPTVYFEFALETAKLAKAAGLHNIFVTNGYMSSQAISLLGPYLGAANIDLKFFKDGTYQKICSAKLRPVLDSIQLLHDAGVWIEISTLLIPKQNDTPQELSGIAKFIAKVNKDIPWHILSFHADYKFNNYSSTPESSLRLANDLGKKEGLRYIYAGNIYGWGQDTFCSACGKILIKRKGFRIAESHLTGNKCVFCQAALPGVFCIDSLGG